MDGGPDLQCSSAELTPAGTASNPIGVGYLGQSDVLPPLTAYLTFDDGPSEWTPQFLDVLKEKNAPSTFFISARNLKGARGLEATYTDSAKRTVRFGDVLVRTYRDGHVIANHTTDHLDLALLSEADAIAQFEENELLINQTMVRAGDPPRVLALIRPPMGSPWHPHPPLPPDPAAALATVARVVANRGVNIMWTVDSTDSADWAQGESYTSAHPPTMGANPPAFADKVARIRDAVLGSKAVMRGDGVVILMHDTHSCTRDALPGIIDGLRALGYAFGTMDDYVLWRWGVPEDILTPGPNLYTGCMPERERGCALIASSPSAGASALVPVCGRMWRAYELLGGATLLGAAQGPAEGLSQAFERGTLVLRPDVPAPCNVQFLPR